jgi:hypothetical protein
MALKARKERARLATTSEVQWTPSHTRHQAISPTSDPETATAAHHSDRRRV